MATNAALSMVFRWSYSRKNMFGRAGKNVITRDLWCHEMKEHIRCGARLEGRQGISKNTLKELPCIDSMHSEIKLGKCIIILQSFNFY